MTPYYAAKLHDLPMPELPEVETTLRSLTPYCVGHRIVAVRVREPRMRWPVPADIAARCVGQTLRASTRRGKYLLLHLDRGTLILHLGMSGSLYRCASDTPPGRHDHIDLDLDDGYCLRLHDPRRFGALLWSDAPERHPLLAPLGIEPLEDAFDGAYIHAHTRGRKRAIKDWLMDAHAVVGVGNIYANESLFQAGIRPQTAAGRLTRPRCERLAQAVKSVLTAAIAAGGSTLRDFVDGNGHPGWFQQQHFVYGRKNCRVCGSFIRLDRHGGRATYCCPVCQK